MLTVTKSRWRDLSPIQFSCNSSFPNFAQYNSSGLYLGGGTAVAQWLRCYATNRKVAGSIPAGPGVDSASNRNEYHEHFLGVKAAGA